MGYGQYSDRSAGKQNPLRHDAKVSRRQVFPTSEIPHLWAHQTQESARNPQGNLYFRGPTIYSYRDSWPLARIYTKAQRKDGSHGGRLVLTNCERYSVTTAQHQSGIERAVSHLTCIAVPFPVVDDRHPDHADNLKYLADEQARMLKEAGRAMTELKVTRLADEAGRLHKAMADYMSFFGIRRKMPALLSFTAAFERARRIENPDPASLDKRERDRAKRQERNRERDEYLAEQRRSVQEAKRKRDFWRIGAARTSWRLGDAFGHDYEGLRSSDCMLRVIPDQHRGAPGKIETSWGASVPVAAASMVWSLVQRAQRYGSMARNGEADTRLSRMLIGDYPLDRIDADGTLHAGCHTIPFSELASVARQLGLS